METALARPQQIFIVIALCVFVALFGIGGIGLAGKGHGAHGAHKRTEVLAYTAANTSQTHHDASALNVCDPTVGLGCVSALSTSTERFVSVSIKDATGQPVAALVRVGSKDTLMCGTTGSPIPIGPSSEAYVFVFSAGSPDCPGPGTSGTATITYSATK
jgi:hypothetical protein